MSRITILTLVAGTSILFLGAGCKSTNPSFPQEFVNVPLYVAARTVPADDPGKIRSSSVIRAYAVGRYIDSNRRNVMHEQHAVYREEQSPRWNLIPQPDAEPVLTTQKERRERYADALSGQLQLASEDMRDVRETVRKVLEGQNSREVGMRELVSQIEELKKRYGVVSNNLIRSSEYINRLEGELGKIRKETELLKLQLRKKDH